MLAIKRWFRIPMDEIRMANEGDIGALFRLGIWLFFTTIPILVGILIAMGIAAP